MAQRILNQKPPKNSQRRDTERPANKLSKGNGAAMEPDEWDLRGGARE